MREKALKLRNKIAKAEDSQGCKHCGALEDLYKCQFHSTIFCYKCLNCGTINTKEEVYPKCRQPISQVYKECVFNPMAR